MRSQRLGLAKLLRLMLYVGGLMFADDFVGLITNTEDLQTLINIVQEFCKGECCYGIFQRG